MRPLHFAQELPGILLEHRLRMRNKPVVLTDWVGFRYWQFSDDNVRDNWKRKSVSDANNVIQYALRNVKPGWICIDLGAHVGSVSVPLLSRTGSDGKVISVEADPANVDKLRANLKLNGFADDYVVHAAVADKSGIVWLRCYPESNGWQTLGNPSFAQGYESFVVDVPAISFEELAEIYNLDLIDFLKMDVEGAELLVLDGMRSFLEESKIGCVIFEVNHLTLEGMGSTVSQLLSFWDDFAYELWRLGDGGTIIAIQGVWPENLVGDCIAFPNSRDMFWKT